MRLKLFYIPGLISLLLLPIIGIGYIFYNDLDKKETAIEFTIIDAIIEDPYYYDIVYDTLHINLQSFEVANNKQFNHLQDTIGFYLGQLTNKKSFCVQFQKGTTYQNLIDVLDVFSNYNIASFEMKKNSIYVKPDKYYQGDFLDLIVLDDQEKDSFVTIFKNKFENMIREYKFIYLLYLFLIIVVITNYIKK